jgi:DNA repair exonuclease SbcCD ATPase subunit
MMALPAVASVDGAEGGTVWPVKSPVTDSAAGQIQAAYRRKRGRASQKRVSRALFQGEGSAPSPGPLEDEEDVVAHAQGVEDAMRSAMALVARTRKAHVLSAALPLLSGDETAAKELVASLERWHKRSDECQLEMLRAQSEERMRRVAAAARRQMQEQIKKAKKQEEARIERVRRAAFAEADTMHENARMALHDAETEWGARVDALMEENEDLASRLQSAENSLSKRQDDVQHEADLGQSTAVALRRQCSLLEKQLRHAESRIVAQQRDLAASQKECAESKGRIGALESSTAAVRPRHVLPRWRMAYLVGERRTRCALIESFVLVYAGVGFIVCVFAEDKRAPQPTHPRHSEHRRCRRCC